MQTFIYIATTQGPVRVQAITEEDPDIKSVVCLDGLAEPLAISDRYHDFVKKGTGLIHREFGHGSYRVDVDKPIDQGDSWQLGIYCAHVLHQKKQLCNNIPGSGDRVFFITGSVKSNGEIIAVDRVPEKMRAAVKQLKEWKHHRCNVTCLLAATQQKTIEVPLGPEVADFLQDDIRFVHNTSDVLKVLGEHKPEVASIESVGFRQLNKQWLLVGLLCLFLVLFLPLVYNMLVFSEDPTNNMSEADILQMDVPFIGDAPLEAKEVLSLIAQVAVQNGSCERSINRPVTVDVNHRFQPVFFDQLCGLNYYSDAAKAMFAFSLDRLGIIALDKKHSGWQVPLPLEQSSDRRYVVIAIYKGDAQGFVQRLEKQLLRWSLQGHDVELLNVIYWVKKQTVSAGVYEHVLVRKK